MSASAVRIPRPRVESVRRRAPEQISLNDYAVASGGAELIDLLQCIPGYELRYSIPFQLGATAADAVDMETWKAATVAARHGLPFAALRTISDPAGLDDAPAAEVAMTPGGGIDVGAVIGSLAADPGQLGGLVTLGSDAEVAFDNLAAAVLQLGIGLAFPMGDA